MGKITMGKSSGTVRISNKGPAVTTIITADRPNEPLQVQPEVITKIEYVDRMVEVPVEKLVTVEKIVTVEKPVEKIVYVDRPVEVFINKEIPVIKFIDREVIKEVVNIEQILELKQSKLVLEKKLAITRIAMAVFIILSIIGFAK